MYVLASNILAARQEHVVPQYEEYCGKGGFGILGIIASIALPWAAPTIFAHIAGSSFLASTVGAAAANTGLLGTITRVVGSAVVGAIGQAGIAYASGARGAQVWQAAGIGALGAGATAFMRGPAMMNVGAGTATTAGAGAATQGGLAPPTPNAVGTAGPVDLVHATNVPTSSNIAANALNSTPITNALRQFVPNATPDMTRQMSAMLVNAAIHGINMGSMNGLVAQQRAELEALQRTNMAAYNQRIAEAQKILQTADQMDPQHKAMMALADAAGISQAQFVQSMRNIAVRQGGSLDAGQAKAYERSAKLGIARTTALAYGKAFTDAQGKQAEMRAMGAGLLGDAPSTALLAKQRLQQTAMETRAQGNSALGGQFIGDFTGPSYKPTTSPVPSGSSTFSGGLAGEDGGYSYGSFDFTPGGP